MAAAVLGPLLFLLEIQQGRVGRVQPWARLDHGLGCARSAGRSAEGPLRPGLAGLDPLQLSRAPRGW